MAELFPLKMPMTSDMMSLPGSFAISATVTPMNTIDSETTNLERVVGFCFINDFYDSVSDMVCFSFTTCFLQ